MRWEMRPPRVWGSYWSSPPATAVSWQHPPGGSPSFPSARPSGEQHCCSRLDPYMTKQKLPLLHKAFRWAALLLQAWSFRWQNKNYHFYTKPPKNTSVQFLWYIHKHYTCKHHSILDIIFDYAFLSPICIPLLAFIHFTSEFYTFPTICNGYLIIINLFRLFMTFSNLI